MSASPQQCCTPPEVALSSPSIVTEIPSRNQEQEGVGEECRTPTAEECKIPPVTSCPPAPKKPRLVVVHRCRRRLFQAELVRVDAWEIDRLFRPRWIAPICVGKRKRCYIDGDE